MPKPNPTASTFEATNSQYHARTEEVSHSGLDEHRDNPALFYQVRVAQTRPGKEPTAAMQFGSLVHAWVLERPTCVVIPKEVLSASGSKAGDAWKRFEAEHAGKILLKAAEAEPLKAIEQALASHEKASQILFDDDNVTELNIRWQDEETGLWLRCRLDRPHRHLTGDLKTAASINPADFAAACVRYGYHRQAAIYQDGNEALTGERLPFVFIAVTKLEPINVACYEMDPDFIELGRLENRRALRHLNHCWETGVWRPPGWGDIHVLKAPAWAQHLSQWEIG